MEAVECGAAALAMVLAYYGAWIPLEQLRVACGVSRDGSKASNIVRAARSFGPVGQGLSQRARDAARIADALHHPLELQSFRGAGRHRRRPRLYQRSGDRAAADRHGGTRSRVHRRRAGHGATEAFGKDGSKPQGIALLLRELRGSKPAVALLVLVSLALVVPSIVAAGFSKIFVDDILIQHTELARSAADRHGDDRRFRAVLTMLRQSLLLRLQTKLAVVMISRFLWHVMALPVEFFTQRHAGDIASRVAANEQIARLLSSGIAANALNLSRSSSSPPRWRSTIFRWRRSASACRW